MIEINVRREKRTAFSMRKLKVYLDGIQIQAISNGSFCSILVEPGDHVIGFSFGSSPVTEILVTVPPDAKHPGILCGVEMNGGIFARMVGEHIPHQVKERATVGKSLNTAVSVTVVVVLVLVLLSILFWNLFKISLFL